MFTFDFSRKKEPSIYKEMIEHVKRNKIVFGGIILQLGFFKVRLFSQSRSSLEKWGACFSVF